ncbi:MAG: glycosyltransferase [Candidatus Magasanikbacteria bacterium]|nr:glycosyltransferase [Candidatus Magasanikbacteria bacterium]
MPRPFYYLATIRLPSDRAHGWQIIKTAAALTAAGAPLTMLVPDRRVDSAVDPFEFFQAAPRFPLVRLPALDLVTSGGWGRVGFFILSYTFYRAARRYLATAPPGIYYTRDSIIAWFLARRLQPVYLELHTLPQRITGFHRRTWERCQGIIVISAGLKEALVKIGIPAGKITIARDAVDLEMFAGLPSQAECRRELGLPLDQPIVVYTGHLYSWKGADTLAAAATHLPVASKAQIYLVGGSAAEAAVFQQRYSNPQLTIVPWQSPERIPRWLAAADVLVLPNSAHTDIGARYTSPLKLFEYLAAGRPIIAADVPALREVLSEETTAWFRPDDPASLARSLANLLADRARCAILAENSRRLSRQFSWQARAAIILAAVNK